MKRVKHSEPVGAIAITCSPLSLQMNCGVDPPEALAM